MIPTSQSFHQLAMILAASGMLGLSLVFVNQQPLAIPQSLEQSSETVQPKPAATAENRVLLQSQPVSLSIPAANISSDIATVGLQPDGAPAVPAGADIDKAAWLNTSVTPGENGTSIIIGHVATVSSGPSVFYNLASLKPGQQIVVKRQDGQRATFSIDTVQSYDKTKFPDQEVYGRTDYPSLRLITCSGNWDDAAAQYSHNTVVYASLISD